VLIGVRTAEEAVLLRHSTPHVNLENVVRAFWLIVIDLSANFCNCPSIETGYLPEINAVLRDGRGAGSSKIRNC